MRVTELLVARCQKRRVALLGQEQLQQKKEQRQEQQECCCCMLALWHAATPEASL
jgi:hypothetical protein